MELIENKRPRKCNRCSNKVNAYYIYKDKAICKDCIEHYLDLKITCSICNTKLKRRNEYININDVKSTKVFCSENCYKSFINDKADLEELDNFLKEYHRVDTLNPRIYVQINEFKKKYKFTTKGILLTLRYIINTLRKEVPIDNISLVQYYYDKAKEDYVKKINREKAVNKLENLTPTITKSIKFDNSYNNDRLKNILIVDIVLEQEEYLLEE